MSDDRECPWNEVDIEVRLKRLAEAFVARDIETAIHKTFDRVRRKRLYEREPANVTIIGPTGVGKSDILARYIAKHPPRRLADGNLHRPVLLVEIRDLATPASVARHMLEMLGLHPCLIKGNTSDLTAVCKRQMMGQGVELVILDEFSNTLSDNGRVRTAKVGTWVKDLCKSKTRTAEHPHGLRSEVIPFAMVGIDKTRRIVEDEDNSELASLTPHRLEIPRYAYDTEERKMEFRHFLEDLDQELPFNEFSGLGTPNEDGVHHLADKIHQVTHGFLRQVGYLVREAAEIAIGEGADRIRERHLSRSVETQRGLLQSSLLECCGKGLTISNPFATSTSPRARCGAKVGYKRAA